MRMDTGLCDARFRKVRLRQRKTLGEFLKQEAIVSIFSSLRRRVYL